MSGLYQALRASSMVATYEPPHRRSGANGNAILKSAGMQVVQDSPRKPSARLSHGAPGVGGIRKQREMQAVLENLAAANSEVRGELQSETRKSHEAMARERRERSEQEAAMVTLQRGLEDRLLKTNEEVERLQRDAQDARAREIEGRQKAMVDEAASKAECNQLEVAFRQSRQELSFVQATVNARVEEWESRCAVAENLEADAQRSVCEARESAIEMCQAMEGDLRAAKGQEIEIRLTMTQAQAACDARCQQLEVMHERSQRALAYAEASASSQHQELMAKIAALHASERITVAAGEQAQSDLMALHQKLIASEDKLKASEIEAQRSAALAKAEAREAELTIESAAQAQHQEFEMRVRAQSRAMKSTEEASEKSFNIFEERLKVCETEKAQIQLNAAEMEMAASDKCKRLEDILELSQQKAIKAQCHEAEAIAAAEAKCLEVEIALASSQRNFQQAEIRQAAQQQDLLAELKSARSQGDEATKAAARVGLLAAEKFKCLEDQAEKLRQQEIEAQKLAAHRNATASAKLDQLEVEVEAAKGTTEQVEAASAAKIELLEANAAASRAEVETIKRRATQQQSGSRVGARNNGRWRLDGRLNTQAPAAAAE